jgi:hypothetical protein
MACRTAVRLIVLLAGLVLTSAQALADVVAPSPDVTTRVIVRASASSQSAQIDHLRLGGQFATSGLRPIGTRSGWPAGAGGLEGAPRLVPTNRRVWGGQESER